MFDIGWSELVVIGIVALIVIGPKELPGVLRMLGVWMGKVRRMASDFQGQFQEAMREAEMADIKKEVDKLADTARDFTHFDPMETARKEIESAIEDKPKPDTPTPPGPDLAATPVEASSAEPASKPAPEPVVQSERDFLGFGDELDKPAQPAQPPQPPSGGGQPA
jgi:sec-independent protein translocase protein TatB